MTLKPLQNDLQIPHKRFTKRMFVLKPISEINLRMKIPKSNFRVYQALNYSKDLNLVKIYNEAPRISARKKINTP